MKKIQYECIVKSAHGKKSAVCTLKSFSKSDALKYSISVVLISWSLAYLCYHFADWSLVTVPSIAILGIYFGIKVYNKWSGLIAIEYGQSICPKCTRELNFSFGSIKQNLEGICHKCACCYEVIIS